ncbi:hypothetical protein IF2G_00579 [Cordyceps javanica]|nr:hypothetical protein IF2G_00579 [Cordyceps javanica]
MEAGSSAKQQCKCAMQQMFRCQPGRRGSNRVRVQPPPPSETPPQAGRQLSSQVSVVQWLPDLGREQRNTTGGCSEARRSRKQSSVGGQYRRGMGHGPWYSGEERSSARLSEASYMIKRDGEAGKWLGLMDPSLGLFCKTQETQEAILQPVGSERRRCWIN